jgi:hypothetical protein
MEFYKARNKKKKFTGQTSAIKAEDSPLAVENFS